MGPIFLDTLLYCFININFSVNLSSKILTVWCLPSLVLLVVLWLPVASMAACPSWPTADRFRLNLNGDEVTDNLTGLIWRRCSEGQMWSGSLGVCTGTAVSFSHESALAHAQSFNTNRSPTGWRLPNVRELASLADRGCKSPAIDTVAFPPDKTLNGQYWASSILSWERQGAMLVDFNTGGVGSWFRTIGYPIRLVRSN